ncbi:MAG: protein-disulfide reductase DsbD domain-containing protein [Pseudomonadota bacterium]
MLLRAFMPAAAMAAVLATPVIAQVPDTVATAEILEGWRGADGRHMTALQITLAPGWKTYWRSPGAAGIPPSFDWSRSENAARVALSYPLPNVFEVAGMRSIGYADQVVFPVAVTPNDTGAPITLAADLLIGVCEEVCVPLEMSVSGTLPADSTDRALDIRIAMANRPMSADEAGVSDVSCEADFMEDGLRLVTRMHLPQLGADEVAVVEYSDPTIWVTEPKVMRNGDYIEMHSDLIAFGEQHFAFFRDETRITVFGGGQAVDIRGC